MENLNQFMDLEDAFDDLNIVILKSHETASLLSKKGYKVKLPIWKGLVAS
tara:strand:- start:86 stop:235 length:150 start_codon:yes stop_codon:yes gene_type:complete